MFRQQTVGRRLYLVVCLFGASGLLVASLWGRNDKCSTVRARPTVLSVSNISIRRLEQKQRCDVNVNHVNQ